MKLMRLSFRKRVLVAVAAIAAVHALSHHLPPYIRSRPRFYPEAWSEAVSLLTEEVGAEAVERQVFYIPRHEVSVPDWGGAVEEPYYRRFGSFIYVSPDSKVILSGDPPFVGSAAGGGRRLLATIGYLGRASVRGAAAEAPWPRGPGVDLYSGREKKDEPYWYVGGGRTRYEATCELRVRLLARYIRRLRKNGDVKPVEGDEEIAAVARAALAKVLPVRVYYESALGSTALKIMERHPSKASLCVLRKVARLTERAKNRPGWVETAAKIPLVGRLVKTDYLRWRWAPQVDYAVWAAENLSGKSPRARAQMCGAEMLRKPNSSVSAYGFAKDSPEEFVRIVAANWAELSEEDRLRYLQLLPPGDEGREICELAAAEESRLTRATALCRLYRLTGDRGYIRKLLEVVVPLDEGVVVRNGFQVWDEMGLWSNRMLAETFEEAPALTEIVAFFAAGWRSLSAEQRNWDLLAEAGIHRVFYALVVAGGRENAEIAMDIVRLWEKYESEAVIGPRPGRGWEGSQSTSYVSGTWLADLLGAQDSFFADRMVEYLSAEAPAFRGLACAPFAASLAAGGDLRALEIFGRALGTERARITGSRAVLGFGPQLFGRFLQGCVVAARIANSGDAFEVVAGLTESDLSDLEFYEYFSHREEGAVVGDLFSRTCSVERLQSALAEDRFAHARPLLYRALVASREVEGDE